MADRMSKMDRSNRIYAAIDLKSFYASVEVVDRKLDPMTTHLVVADRSRTSKTICLAVSPSLKAYGIPGRARLFEVEQKVEEVNRERRRRAPGGKFTGSSCDAVELAKKPDLALDFIAAPPQMAHYMEKSSQIYQIYLKYVAPEDIHSYSIDELILALRDECLCEASCLFLVLVRDEYLTCVRNIVESKDLNRSGRASLFDTVALIVHHGADFTVAAASGDSVTDL